MNRGPLPLAAPIQARIKFAADELAALRAIEKAARQRCEHESLEAALVTLDRLRSDHATKR